MAEEKKTEKAVATSPTPAAGAGQSVPSKQQSAAQMLQMDGEAISERVPMLFLKELGATVKEVQAEVLKDERVRPQELAPANAASLSKQVIPCLVIASIEQSNDIVKYLNLLKLIKDDVKHNRIKFLVLSKVKNPSIVKTFEQFGCHEFIMEPIAKKSLMFKIGLHIKALYGERKKLRDNALRKEPDEVRVKKNTGKEADAKEGGEKEVNVKKAAANEKDSDTWVFKGNKPKKAGGKWTMRMKGPDPGKGKWMEAGKNPDGSSQWRFLDNETADKVEKAKAAGKSLEEAMKEAGADKKEGWAWSGDQPQHNNGDWSFNSEKPDLSFYNPDGTKSHSKVEMDASGEIVAAEDSKKALAKVAEIEAGLELEKSKKKKGMFSGEGASGESKAEPKGANDLSASVDKSLDAKKETADLKLEAEKQGPEKNFVDAAGPQSGPLTASFKKDKKDALGKDFVEKKEKQAEGKDFVDKKEKKDALGKDFKDATEKKDDGKPGVAKFAAEEAKKGAKDFKDAKEQKKANLNDLSQSVDVELEKDGKPAVAKTAKIADEAGGVEAKKVKKADAKAGLAKLEAKEDGAAAEGAAESPAGGKKAKGLDPSELESKKKESPFSPQSKDSKAAKTPPLGKDGKPLRPEADLDAKTSAQAKKKASLNDQPEEKGNGKNKPNPFAPGATEKAAKKKAAFEEEAGGGKKKKNGGELDLGDSEGESGGSGGVGGKVELDKDEEGAAWSQHRSEEQKKKKWSGHDSDQSPDSGDDGDKFVDASQTARDINIKNSEEEIFEYPQDHFGVLNGTWERVEDNKGDWFVYVDPLIRTKKDYNFKLIKTWWVFRGEDRPAYLAPVKTWQFRKVRPEKIAGFEKLAESVREYLKGLLPGAKKEKAVLEAVPEPTGEKIEFKFVSPTGLAISMSELAQSPAISSEKILETFCGMVSGSLKGAAVSVFRFTDAGKLEFLVKASEVQKKFASQLNPSKKSFVEKDGARACLCVLVFAAGGAKAIGGLLAEAAATESAFLNTQSNYLSAAGVSLRGCLIDSKIQEFKSVA